MFGQHAPCEWILLPNTNIWPKRPNIAFARNKSPLDEDVNADLSTGLWQGFHDWMFCGPYNAPSYLCYDDYARGFYRTINQAVSDWLDVTENDDEFMQVKIRFCFPDLRRKTNFAMRGAQFLEALHPNQALFEKAAHKRMPGKS